MRGGGRSCLVRLDWRAGIRYRELVDVSVFLTRIFGLYLVIMGLATLLHRKALPKVVDDLVENAALMYITGIFVLALGLLLVLSHNVWVGRSRVIVTALSWLVLLKGVVFVLLPHGVLVATVKTFNRETWYVGAGAASVLVGLYLVCKGFFLF